jgi:radial spoke head protein 4/6
VLVPQSATHRIVHAELPLHQVLEEKPTNAVDLLETTLLVKKKGFDAKEVSPLLPVHVRSLATAEVSFADW